MLDPASKLARGPALGDVVSARTLAALEKLKRLHPDEREVVQLLRVSRAT